MLLSVIILGDEGRAREEVKTQSALLPLSSTVMISIIAFPTIGDVVVRDTIKML